jgi:Transglutaminase-like superfamily
MYFLSSDCHVCNSQGYWIILNISRDKYLCVTQGDLSSIGSRIYGLQHHYGDAENRQCLDAAGDSLIDSLVAKGVLTSNSDQGKAFVESGNVGSETAVDLLGPIGQSKVPLFCAARFFLACTRTDWYLRKRNLPLALARIKRRRLRAGSPPRFIAGANATKPILVFKDLRPFYPRPYLCLFDSLALLEFLASYHSYPRIVFGVVADPFQAHCWLQDGNVLLNDDLERVGKYKPILSV